MTIAQMRENQDVPVVIIDKNGDITYINNKFIEVFGFTHSDAIGQPVLIIIPNELHDAHNMGLSRFIYTEKPTLLHKPLNLKAKKKNGDEFDAEHFIVAEKKGNDWEIGATIKPL
ncbi:MAG: PAS domain S-box protein [Candidatus Omnitrophica bacterium]|nr:PAS domain S-box protein [Candidatus Omnitrophota bacterium]MCB9747402.1 PAS domain S-box protein [Candidatus Omnitrophota bacterium]